MQSKTKYNITPPQIRSIFAAAGLGDVTDVTPMSDGWYNNVLSVTANGKDYVIKVAPELTVKVLTHEHDLLRQELRFIALLREHGVSVPKVYFGDCGKTLIPCDYFIMEKLGGARLDKANLKGEAKEQADAQIHGILDAFHGIKGEGFGYEQMGLEPNWYLALRRMTQALVDDCAGFGKSCRFGKKLLRYIDRHRAVLESVESVLVNFDLHSMNLFYDQGKLTLIDLERCFWGDWIGDRILRGYSPPKDFSRDERIRFYLLEGYLGLIMYTEKYSRYRPWNMTWWLDVGGSLFFRLVSLTPLKNKLF